MRVIAIKRSKGYRDCLYGQCNYGQSQVDPKSRKRAWETELRLQPSCRVGSCVAYSNPPKKQRKQRVKNFQLRFFICRDECIKKMGTRPRWKYWRRLITLLWKHGEEDLKTVLHLLHVFLQPVSLFLNYTAKLTCYRSGHTSWSGQNIQSIQVKVPVSCTVYLPTIASLPWYVLLATFTLHSVPITGYAGSRYVFMLHKWHWVFISPTD